MGLLEKISSWTYPLVIVGMVVGLLWGGLQYLTAHSAAAAPLVPHPVAIACAALAIGAIALLVEKLVPLRGMSELRWVYQDRPKGRLRSVDSWTAGLLLSVGLTGLLLGAAVGHPELALVGVVAQVGSALTTRPTLPNLLAAGRMRMVGSGGLAVQDSELVADALAASWVSWRTPNFGSLTLTRLLRRNYLLISALLILAAAVALRSAVLVPFAAAWTILGAGIYRCADVSRVAEPTRAWIPALLVHVAVGLSTSYALGIHRPLLLLLLGASIMHGSYRRGQPRRIFTLTFSDNGMGMSAPPELIGYYLKGLLWVVVASAVGLTG